jgi:hypothetical protein
VLFIRNVYEKNNQVGFPFSNIVVVFGAYDSFVELIMRVIVKNVGCRSSRGELDSAVVATEPSMVFRGFRGHRGQSQKYH